MRLDRRSQGDNSAGQGLDSHFQELSSLKIWKDVAAETYIYCSNGIRNKKPFGYQTFKQLYPNNPQTQWITNRIYKKTNANWPQFEANVSVKRVSGHTLSLLTLLNVPTGSLIDLTYKMPNHNYTVLM